MEKVYFETSAFNYLLKTIRFESFLHTRELQRLRRRELLISPVTLWEVMLTGRSRSDFLLYSAQNLFSEQLLGTPSEVITRYLLFAYPENKVNYSCFTDLEIGEIWRRMVHHDSVTFHYNQDRLVEKTKLIRRISRNLSSILRYPGVQLSDATLEAIAVIVHSYYQCLSRDGFLPSTDRERYDKELLYKLLVLVVLILFILRLDLDSTVIDKFWRDLGLSDDDHTKRMMHVFEHYPELFKRGPLLEIAIMAYHQLQMSTPNRGLILDSMHIVYAPYVDTIITADQNFAKLKSKEEHYAKKLVHVSEIALREEPFYSSR